MEDLNSSLAQYKEQNSEPRFHSRPAPTTKFSGTKSSDVTQILMVNEALASVSEVSERESLLTLQNDLTQLIQLTQESLDTLTNKSNSVGGPEDSQKVEKAELDDEYALFMQEMTESGAYGSSQEEKSELVKESEEENNEDSDIENELASLLGMKCAVYHTHKWGGQPTLHNAMVSAVVPRLEDDKFKDLQVRVLFTNPTHTEMLPCPFYLDGECRFSDEQCRYSHGAVTPLSNLKEAIEPNFDLLKLGSTVLMKLKPPDDEDISLTKKSTEKYHLWHRGVLKSIDSEKKVCSVRLDHGVKSGEKRKSSHQEEYNVRIEDIFPLNNASDGDSSSDDSLSDTEYPDSKVARTEPETDNHTLLVEKSLHNNGPAMGEWERHTRGIGSKLMLAMGYVPGTGLGAAGGGRVQPVAARVLPAGRSLDHCMAISERHAAQDPLKVEQRLKRLQKKEEERNKRAYEREKERERRNVFNFLNRTIGDTDQDTQDTQDRTQAVTASVDVKQSTSKDLNIEQFKITEDARKLEREIIKLNNSLTKYSSGTSIHRTLSAQVAEKNKELDTLRRRDQQITKEQKHRKDKVKMTVF